MLPKKELWGTYMLGNMTSVTKQNDRGVPAQVRLLDTL